MIFYSTKGQTSELRRCPSTTSLTLSPPHVAMSEQQPLSASSTSTNEIHGSLIRRSLHAMSEILSPFSPGALAQLPKKPRRPSRYTRADAIPDIEPTEEGGQMPTVRDYHSITVPPQVRVPKKTATPVRVESKVWFANERSAYPFFFFLLSLFSTSLGLPFPPFSGLLFRLGDFFFLLRRCRR